MKRKITSILLAAAMTATVLTGCTSEAQTGTPAPAADGQQVSEAAPGEGHVYYLNFKPEADAAWQDIAKTYTEQTGVPVPVVTAASGTYEETLSAEIIKEEAPTLFQVNGPVGLANWTDYCYDLNGSSLYNELTSESFALKDGDAVKGIAYVIESYGIITNTELLEKAGYTLDDIKSFDDLKKVAEDITARKDDLGFAAFTSAGMDPSSDWRFKTHLANLPIYFEYQADKIDTTDKIKGTYLDNYKNIWDLYINNSAYDPATLATGGYDAEAEFGKKQAVFYQNGNWEYDALVNNYKLDPAKLQMIPFYCGVAGEENAGLNSGTENCWAVNAKASKADIEATIDFMVWMVTDAEASKLLAGTFGSMPYKQAAAPDNVFLAQANEYANQGKYTMTWAFNYTPNVDSWRAGLVSAMNQYDAAQTDANWKTVETAFVQGWATQYKAANN